MCSWLVDVPHLKAKKVTSKHKEQARTLRVDFLRALAAEQALMLPEGAADALADDPSLREGLSLAAWARALVRRLEGLSEGPATLALWRGFAWTAQGSPKKVFSLTARDVLAAEEAVSARIRAASRST
ncbi:MAG: hypothetical protein QM765_33530 [Myxococcales bacterium]